MPQETRNHRNGGRPQVLPTSDKMDSMSKPHSVRSTITNTPDPVVYVAVFVLIVFGVTFLIVGGVYANQCNLQPMLPIWVLIMGIILAIWGAWHGFVVYKIKKEPFRRIGVFEKTIGAIISLLLFGWFIAGNVWVFKAWSEVPDYAHWWFENSCNKSLFILAFIAVIALDVMAGVLLIGFCFWGITKVVVHE